VFISKKAYQDLRDENIKLQAECRVLDQQNKVLQVNLDHFRIRANQIEKERAQLIFHALGVKIPTPEIHRVEPVFDSGSTHPFSESDIFNGLSDTEAAAQGVDWDAEGRLVYTK